MPWEGSQEPEQYWGDHLEPDMGAQLLSEMPAFPGSLADALEGNAASRTQGLFTSTESQFWRSHSGGNSRNANFAQTRNWIRLPASATARYFQCLKVTDVRTEDAYSGATISHLMTAASKEVVTVLANQTESSPVDLLPVSPAVADAQATIARVSLVRLESAPDVLAVNSDFDEGRIDATTHFAIPDCDDMAGVDLDTGVGNTLVELDAERNHLDAKHLQGDDVVDDLHRGWFGVRPDALAPNLWEGATITVRKIDRIDTSTGRKESGQVRFYAKWSSGY